MRKVCCILTGIFLSLLFTTCKQFTADIDDYLSYWSTVVSSAGYSIDKPTQTSADGSMCVPSADNLTVTVKLNNPKNVRLIMPDKGNVIRFPGLSTQPVYGTDYTLAQKTSDTLTLEYKSTFLGTHEWSNGDIGPEITFIATDGRIFRSKFSLNLKVDTAPALEYAEIGKTATADSDGNHFYVLIFRVKDMDSTITDSSIHKDIKKLIVTAGGVPSEIPLSFNAGKTDFETGGDLLAESALHVLDIDHPLPGGNWLLCLKTDVKVGEAEKEYAVSIKDAQGLSSAVIRASTQKNKLANVQLFDGSTEITGTSDSNPKGIPGINGKTLTAKTAFTGTAITGTVYKKKADGTWEQLSGSGGTVSGTTTAAVNLPALAASGTEALYKISLKAQLNGYDDSDSKDFFVKLLWQEVPVLKLMQNFSSSGTPSHCISAETKGYVTEDIIPDAGWYNYSNPLVIYNYLAGGYRFELSASAGSTVKYRLNGGAEQSATTSAVISVSHSVVHTLEVWAERDAIAGPHTTLYSKGVQAVSNYTQLKNVAQNAPANGTRIEIVIGDNITASADTEIAVTGGKKLILQSSPSTTVRTVNAGGLGRILKVSGTGSQLELNGIQLTGGNAADGKGGAVCVEAGGVLWLYNKTVITPSTGSDINTPGKNDVYLANGAEITLGSLTTTEPIVARITPNYTDGNTVLTGNPASVSTNYTKFSVTQPDDGFLWTIKSDGTLKAIPTIINGSDSGAWQKLRELVRIAPAGAVITINGTITATNEGSGDTANWGEIIIDKNLTIKGKKTDRTDTLNANKDDFGTVPFRIFKVELGKKLTLENLTLKNGKNNETDPGGSPNPNGKGGAIYSKGELEIRNVLITNCEAKYSGGGIYCSMFGTTSTDERKLVIANTEVASCKALDTTHGLGGGVSIQGSDCLMNVKITDVMIKNNDAGSSAAGLCLYGSHNATTTADSVVLTRVTLHKNKLTGTSAAGGAGMVFATYGPNNAITLKNCTVTKNESTTIGGGILLRTSSSGNVCGKLILENSSVTENKAQNGGGVYVNWSNLVMKNTDFTSNTATAEGGGVYIAKGTFEMEGSATVTPSAEAHKNDVYLAADTTATAKIKLNGALTGTPPVARITVPNDKYLPTTQVLTADTGVTLANETYKFAVTPKGSEKWTVGGNGCLKEGRYTEVPYGQLETYLANASSTEVNYIEVTGISAADLTGSYGSPPDPGALGQKIKNNSAKKVALKLPSGLSVTDMSACFSQCENLVSLENFPSGVTDMRACFYGCENLTTVPAIPATVTSMMECFRFCRSLTTALNIPAGVYDMTRCFQYCEKLQSIKMNCPYGVNFNGAFSGCDALPNGGIQVPSAQLGTYKANAGTMGTSADKFSAIP